MFQRFSSPPKQSRSGHGYSFQLAKTQSRTAACEYIVFFHSRAGGVSYRILTDMRKAQVPMQH
jgi:hypothetical protein